MNDPEGYVCLRKDFPSGREEDEMLYKMSKESYRLKGKVCHEPSEGRKPEEALL